MRVTKGKIILYTVISALLYILIEYAVTEKPFTKKFFGGEYLFSEETSWLTWLGLLAIIGLGLWQAMELGDREIDVEDYDMRSEADGQVHDPAWWKALSGNVWWSVLWLPLRFVLGIHWLEAGWHKIQDPGWVSSGNVMRNGQEVFMNRGDAMKGFLMGAYTPDPESGKTKAVFGWYADFLKFMVDHNWTSWFGPLIAWGEVLVGVGLLLGGLVGIAAFFGTLMNMAFMLAGTVSANPWMFGMTVFLILGWKVAGHLGLDRWFLKFLRTPWDRMTGTRVAEPVPVTHTSTVGYPTTTQSTTTTTTTREPVVGGTTTTIRPDDNHPTNRI